MDKLALLYSGKAKSLYTTNNTEQLIMSFRDDTSAFDGEKKAKLSGKGQINSLFNAHIMSLLESQGIKTGFIETLSETDALVRKLEMIPVECVVRNYTAGSVVRRLGVKSNLKLDPPLFELFLKNDEKHDPLITVDHAIAFNFATANELKLMRDITLKTNSVLKAFFDEHGLILVDFKLEFGKLNNIIYLGDEISPDNCRIWDKDTKEVYDKDIFRQNLGDVVAGYTQAAKKLGITID